MPVPSSVSMIERSRELLTSVIVLRAAVLGFERSIKSSWSWVHHGSIIMDHDFHTNFHTSFPALRCRSLQTVGCSMVGTVSKQAMLEGLKPANENVIWQYDAVAHAGQVCAPISCVYVPWCLTGACR